MIFQKFYDFTCMEITKSATGELPIIAGLFLKKNTIHRPFIYLWYGIKWLVDKYDFHK